MYFDGLVTLKNIDIKLIMKKLSHKSDKITQVDIAKIQELDTSGAYIILKTLSDLNLTKNNLTNCSEKNKNLINLVSTNLPTKKDDEFQEKSNIVFNSIYMLGKNTNNLLTDIRLTISFLGAIVIGYFNFLRRPYKLFFSIVLGIHLRLRN